MKGDWQSKVGMLIAFAVPFVSVQVAAIFMSPPQTAVATPQPTSGGTINIGRPKVNVTDAERAAAVHAVSLRQEPFERSPMDYRVDDTDVTVVIDPVVEPNGTPSVPLPKVRLQLIWASSSGDIALIDGERYGEGDQLKGIPWIVHEIDAAARSVVLQDLDGTQTVRVSIDAPPRPSARTPSGPRRR